MKNNIVSLANVCQESVSGQKNKKQMTASAYQKLSES